MQDAEISMSPVLIWLHINGRPTGRPVNSKWTILQIIRHMVFKKTS